MNRLKHLFTGRHYHRLRVPVQISPPCEGISASGGDPSLRHRLPLLPPPISASLRVKEYNAWRQTTHQRKTLPPELSRDVVTLTCESPANGGVCDVYVVGTVHGLPKSCRDVQAVIDLVKPQVVFVELCSNRAYVIVEDFDKDELESEFAVAYGTAKKYGAKVILGDRLVDITRRRLWAKMPLWHMIRWPLWSMMRSLYHSVKKDGLLRLPKPLPKQEWDDCDLSAISHDFEKFCKMFPTVTETLLHERDQYMSASLLEVARKHNSVVAVVGAAHLPGIQKNWKQPIDFERLLEMPSEKTGLLKWRLSRIIFKTIITTILVILLATMIALIRVEIYLLQRVTRADDNGVED